MYGGPFPLFLFAGQQNFQSSVALGQGQEMLTGQPGLDLSQNKRKLKLTSTKSVHFHIFMKR